MDWKSGAYNQVNQKTSVELHRPVVRLRKTHANPRQPSESNCQAANATCGCRQLRGANRSAFSGLYNQIATTSRGANGNKDRAVLLKAESAYDFAETGG